MTEPTPVVHRGGPHQCRDVSRSGPPPAVGDKVILDDADFYNAVARVVHVAPDGHAWVYADRWDQTLDDRDLLHEGWGQCELPPAFEDAVYRFRVEPVRERIAPAVVRYIAYCIDADPTQSDLARQSCANMRDYLHRVLDELRSLTSEPDR